MGMIFNNNNRTGLTFIITFGLGLGTVISIVLAVVFGPWYVSVGVFGTIVTISGIIGFVQYHKGKPEREAQKLANRHQLQEIERRDKEMSWIVDSNGRAFNYDTGQWYVASRPTKEVPAQLTLEAGPVELLPLLYKIPNLAVIGPGRAGKTNLAQFWAKERGTRFLICDIKGTNPWSPNCEIYTGTDQIERAIAEIERIAHYRRVNGFVNDDPVTLFLDEIHELLRTETIDNPFGRLVSLLILNQEYKIFGGFTSHGITRDYLGHKAAGMIENFQVVNVSYNLHTDIYRATTDLGEGLQEVVPPGDYVARNPGQQSVLILPPDPVPTLPEPTPQEAQVLMLHARGKSVSAIAQKILGSKGGPQNKQIKQILTKFGRV